MPPVFGSGALSFPTDSRDTPGMHTLLHGTTNVRYYRVISKEHNPRRTQTMLKLQLEIDRTNIIDILIGELSMVHLDIPNTTPETYPTLQRRLAVLTQAIRDANRISTTRNIPTATENVKILNDILDSLIIMSNSLDVDLISERNQQHLETLLRCFEGHVEEITEELAA